MELIRRALAEGRKPDLQELVDAIPYCRFLGIEVDRKGTELTTILRFDQKLIGNPVLPALHGGVVGAFLEVTAVIQLMLEAESEDLPKPVDIGIDYLRSGKPVDTYALIAVTMEDLYPDEKWNFVFGQAMLQGGAFTGQLFNLGTANFNANFTASNGIATANQFGPGAQELEAPPSLSTTPHRRGRSSSPLPGRSASGGRRAGPKFRSLPTSGATTSREGWQKPPSRRGRAGLHRFRYSTYSSSLLTFTVRF